MDIDDIDESLREATRKRTATNRALDTQKFLVRDNRANLMGWKAFLGPQVGGPTLPAYAAASRRDDLSGLPPTWIYAGDLELFYAKDRRYAELLEAAGVDTTFVTVTGTAHGFENWAADNPKAIELVTQAGDWLAAKLG